MKKVLKITGVLLIIIILLITGLVINTFSQFKKLNSGKLATEFITDTIPFYYSNSKHILIDVNVEGSDKKYPFILDSGASNFIFSNHVEEFDLETNGKSIGMGATGNIFFSNIREIDSLKINNLFFKDLNANEQELNFNCIDDVYGLIGAGLMQHLVWQIDFKTKQIIVSKRLEDLNIGENIIEIPLKENPYSHHLSMSVKFNNGRKNKSVLLDLGNSGILSIDEKLAIEDSLNFKKKIIDGKISMGLGGESKSLKKEKYYLIDTIHFNKTSFNIQKVPVNTTPKGIDILGLGFFKNYKTTISWADKKLILEPYDNESDFIWKTSGFISRFNKELDKTIIKGIIEGTPASREKIPLNAEIISINGKKFLTESDYCDYKKSIKKDTINLTIKDKGEIKNYALIREAIFN